MKKNKRFDSSIVKEDESKTTTNSRHYIINNGTRKAVFSTASINYYDTAEKKWKETDNSLEATENGYRAKFGNYEIKLTEGESEHIEVGDGTSLISWDYIGSDREVRPGMSKHRSKLKVDTRSIEKMHFGAKSRAVYERLEGKDDLEYIIEGNDLKENIIVKEKRESYNYYFSLHVEGFKVVSSNDNGQIEFYKSEEETPEFVIKKPFMYDAVGARSDSVQYSIDKINEENMTFCIKADEKWINAAERVFPICIDPQLSTVSEPPYISVSQTRYQLCECGSNCTCESEWVNMGEVNYDSIILQRGETDKTNATITINKSKIDLSRNTLISAKLILETYYDGGSAGFAQIKIGDSTYAYPDSDRLEIDISDLYRSSTRDFNIEMEMLSVYESRQFKKYPILELEHIPIVDEPVREGLSMGSGANAELDLVSGNAAMMIEDIQDPILGVKVSHIYKPNDEIDEYGEGFRLNLDEKLEKAGTTATGVQYVYTDPKGDKHTFDEHFYYIGIAGRKVYVDSKKEYIKADADGRLWYSGNREVFRELTTTRGLRASARLEGINNSEWSEQRIGEEKQCEEQIKSYESTLTNFVAVSVDNGNILTELSKIKLSDPDSCEKFIYSADGCSSVILTKEEAYSYKSILTNVGGVENISSEQKEQLKAKNIEHKDFINICYKEYVNLEQKLEIIKLQTPVCYLTSEATVKGFNKNGNLIVIQDNHSNRIVVEREKYSANTAKTRIASVYDKDGHTMRFVYNENKKLSQIVNSIGEVTSFEYSGVVDLVKIEREKLPSVDIEYVEGNISKISFSDNTETKLSYGAMGQLSGISRTTSIYEIRHGETVSYGESSLSELSIEYTEDETKLTDEKSNTKIYKMDMENELVLEYYEVVGNRVGKAEKYTYNSNNLLIKTERAHRSCLNRYPYRSFNIFFAVGSTESITYDTFKQPVTVITEKSADEDCSCYGEKTETVYTYNDSQKLEEAVSAHSYVDCCECFDEETAIEKYYYNNAGDIVRKERYIDGEKHITGVSIKEYEYDKNRYLVRSCAYNSLDTSSKFYTESELDENGNVLAELDESGEHKTTFDYERDGVSVRTEKLPNGSKFSYGRDKEGKVTAITHSTENGEENSNKKQYTSEVVTQLESGNNKVNYTYDAKRRVKSVSLNGEEDYVKYEYSGDNTDYNKVSFELKNGITGYTVKNRRGKVTHTECGGKTVDNTYNEDQKITQIIDSVSGGTVFGYDCEGNKNCVNSPELYESYEYDSTYKTLNRRILSGVVSQTYEYGYKLTADKALDCIIINNENTVRPNTDVLGRHTGKTIEVGENKIAEEKISYAKFGDHATNMPSTVRFATNGIFNEGIQYKYDNMGNIIEIFENGRSTCRYEYDALGRITREDNVAFGKTTTWAYDNNGNILARYEYAITAKPTSELHLLDSTCVNYAYVDNSDQLMSYNGETFVYDDIGNPTTYRGKSATWAYGRELVEYDGNTFAYDARGRRIGKNDITFTYDSNGNLIKQSNGLEFFYDHTGVFAVKYNDATYFYRKNAQNDIIALLDNAGAVMVKYVYDAWGNCKVFDTLGNEITDGTHIGILNPFRYRSYYYDHGIGLYFLKTRYYDPEIARFITIDYIFYLNPNSINGLNLYAYCFSNPVILIDPTGEGAIWGWITDNIIDPTGQLVTATIFGAIDIINPHNNTNIIGRGITISGVAGVSASLSFNILLSRGGEIGFTVAVAGGGGAGLGASLANTLVDSSATSIKDLEGVAITAGGSVSIPVYGPLSVCAGYDLSGGLSARDGGYYISTFSSGAGVGVGYLEGHGQMGYTWAIPAYSFYDK